MKLLLCASRLHTFAANARQCLSFACLATCSVTRLSRLRLRTDAVIAPALSTRQMLPRLLGCYVFLPSRVLEASQCAAQHWFAIGDWRSRSICFAMGDWRSYTGSRTYLDLSATRLLSPVGTEGAASRSAPATCAWGWGGGDSPASTAASTWNHLSPPRHPAANLASPRYGG